MTLLFLILWLIVAVEGAPCRDNQHCQSCDINKRCSSECYRGFYGYQCNNRCSAGCEKNICHLTTSGNGNCTYGCRPGYYGTRCPIPCKTLVNTCRKCPQECEGGFCQLESSCVQGCQDSYYGTACKFCPAGCEVCDKVSGTCEVCLHCEGNCTNGCRKGCKGGFFGNLCEHKCSLGCLSGCNQNSGDCFRCKVGLFGGTCESQCPKRCEDEECHMDGICMNGCKEGWYGSRCQSKCSKRCLTEDCDQIGLCPQGCKDGWYGPKCESKCETGCQGEICDRYGTCTYGCIVDFYGIRCENQCSASCLNRVCDNKDGSCKSCEKGFYGSHCNMSCVRCVQGSCKKDTGHCNHGCLSNYRGEYCQHNCKGNCYGEECREICKLEYGADTLSEGYITSNYIPYMVAAVVLVFVSAMGIYVVYRFKRRQIVINSCRTGGQGYQLHRQRNPTEEATEPTVSFYCEMDNDPMRSPQLPRRC